MEKVTDMFRHTFPYTTIYPSLGNLDITSSSMLSNRFPKPGSPYHRARRPHGQGSNRNGHRRRGKKGNVIFKANETKHILSITSSTARTRKYLQSIIYPTQFYKIAQTSRLPSFLIYVTLSFAILSFFQSIYTGLIERDSC